MNELISNIINKYYSVIDESKGSITLTKDNNGVIVENTDLLNLVSQIYNDVLGRQYVDNVVMDYTDISEIDQVSASHVYKLTYNVDNLSWLHNLVVFIIETDDVSIKGISYFESKKFTYISNDCYESVAIGLINPSKNFVLEDTIIHELKHLYISLLHYVNNVRKNEFDIEVYNYNAHMYENIDFEHISMDEINERIHNSRFIRSAVFRMLYELNADEIEAHKENICMAIKRYMSNHPNNTYDQMCREVGQLNIYKNMQYILDCLKSDRSMYNLINTPYVIDLYFSIFKTYKRKSHNADFIINKFQLKLNSILKHTKTQYEFWKHFYDN